MHGYRLCWLIHCARQRIVFVVSWYLIVWCNMNSCNNAADDDFSHPFHCSSSRRILSNAFQLNVHVLQSHSNSNECLCNSSSSRIVHTHAVNPPIKQSKWQLYGTRTTFLPHFSPTAVAWFDIRLNRVCVYRIFYGWSVNFTVIKVGKRVNDSITAFQCRYCSIPISMIQSRAKLPTNSTPNRSNHERIKKFPPISDPKRNKI